MERSLRIMEIKYAAKTAKDAGSIVLSLLIFMFFSFLTAYGQQEEINYDESKVPEYTLPTLFGTESGEPVKTVKSWERHKRREIIPLFEKNMYGAVPDHFDGIRFEVLNENPEAMDGTARLKEVDIVVTRQNKSVTIRLNLFVPTGIPKPAPVFLLINHRGPENMDPTRKIKKEFWPAEKIIERGYAAAVFDVEDVADDNPETFMEDLLKKFYPGQLDKPDGMRALSAWAWGAMRVMDYFIRDSDIDQQRAVIVGHSRGGKAALWTGAQDRRWAITVSNESGAGGAALSRRRFGETVRAINSSFPHWFTPNFSRFNDKESELPVDQHMLIACMAPRPVYVASAEEDRWADPKGEYLSLKKGAEIYQKIYRLPVDLIQNVPEIEDPITESYAGYHIRNGEHDLTLYDWNRFMDFADYHFEIGGR